MLESPIMAVKLPVSMAYFTDIGFNKLFTHNDPNIIHPDSTQIQNQIKFPHHKSI